MAHQQFGRQGHDTDKRKCRLCNAERIERLNQIINKGHGSNTARTCAAYMRMNDQHCAVIVWHLDADKVRQYPEMFKLLTEILGPDTEVDKVEQGL